MGMLLTPLEQFQIISVFPIKLFCLDFSFTNVVLINLIVLFLVRVIVYFFSSSSDCLGVNSFFFVPTTWQTLFESTYEIASQLVYDNINLEGEKYVPFISMLFTFTMTSHLIVTFTLSLSIFIGVVLIGIKKYEVYMLSIFLPANTSFGLALLLVPIELISYIFKPISLGVRLFANLMAGHTLLKVIVGFAWSLLLLEDILSIIHLFPLLVLILLMGLELGVAIIQAYVFTVLTCIYLNDSINLSH